MLSLIFHFKNSNLDTKNKTVRIEEYLHALTEMLKIANSKLAKKFQAIFNGVFLLHKNMKKRLLLDFVASLFPNSINTKKGGNSFFTINKKVININNNVTGGKKHNECYGRASPWSFGFQLFSRLYTRRLTTTEYNPTQGVIESTSYCVIGMQPARHGADFLTATHAFYASLV